MISFNKLLFKRKDRLLTGFTLIEVVVAVFIITVGALGAFSLIQQTTAFYPVISSQLTATYLAQEGIEIVRNIRDTNWLEQRDDPALAWDDGLPQGEWEADYESDNLMQAWVGEGRFLNIDGNNFYSYSAGTPTKFKRKITIQKPVANKMIVSVQVTWQERGRTHRVTAETELYNWR